MTHLLRFIALVLVSLVFFSFGNYAQANQLGETCTTQADCGDNLVCRDFVCARAAGTGAERSSCSTGAECAEGLECRGNICTAAQDTGGDPNASNDQTESDETGSTDGDSGGGDSSGEASAPVERSLEYESFTSFPGFGRISSLCQLTDALWQLGFIVLIVSVFGMIVYAGVMYTTAGVNVNNVQAAKGKFANAISGLILGLSVLLILETINVDLTNPTCALQYVGAGTDVFENFNGSAGSGGSGDSGGGSATITSAGSFASGIYTGPAHTIGSGSAYHIDSKFPKDMSWEDIDALFLAMAQGYAANNRRIEFSNAAVSGQVYDPNAPQSERIAMLQRAAAAHAPRSRHSFDYYVPTNGTDRWSSSAEDVEMILPSVPGGRAVYASGGRYGHYVRVYDANGNFVYTTGHGNDTKPLPSDITF